MQLMVAVLTHFTKISGSAPWIELESLHFKYISVDMFQIQFSDMQSPNISGFNCKYESDVQKL